VAAAVAGTYYAHPRRDRQAEWLAIIDSARGRGQRRSSPRALALAPRLPPCGKNFDDDKVSSGNHTHAKV